MIFLTLCNGWHSVPIPQPDPPVPWTASVTSPSGFLVYYALLIFNPTMILFLLLFLSLLQEQAAALSVPAQQTRRFHNQKPLIKCSFGSEPSFGPNIGSKEFKECYFCKSEFHHAKHCHSKEHLPYGLYLLPPVLLVW